MNTVPQEILPLIYGFLLVVFIPLFFVVLIPTLLFVLKKTFYNSLSPKLVAMLVKVGSKDETNFKNCEQLFAGIYGIKRSFIESLFGIENRVSFEIIAKKGEVSFFIICPEKISTIIEKQIYGVYKDVEVDFVDIPKIFDRGSHNIVYELKQENGLFTMVNSFDEKQDPLKTFLSTFSKLDTNEVLVYQLIVAPAPATWIKAVRGILAHSNKEGVSLDSSFKESIEKKITKQGFYTVIRLLSVSDDYNRAKINIDNALAALGQFNNPKTNSIVKKIFVLKKSTIKKLILRELNILELRIPVFDILLFLNNSLFNTEELANIFHFPNKEVAVTGLKRIDFKKAAAPSYLPQEGIVLGKNKFRGIENIIRINDQDRLRHHYILGQTGSGKSWYLFSQILQDIYRGKGVCVLDPHGPDIENLLKKIPPHREKDVIYFNAADFERPIGINVLQILSKNPESVEIQRNIIINSFIEMLRKLYDPQNQGIVGPFFERSVRNCMLTAMVDPDATLVDVVQLLMEDSAAEKYLPKITDPQIIAYWKEERAKMTDQTRSESMGYLTSKFSRFTQDKFIRNIIAQSESSINIPDIMQNQKILLINLSKGTIGAENSSFLGLLLVPKVLDAAMARAEKLKSGEAFPDFYLYVDEFQNFATDSFESILSEARKFKLGMTVANQYISQLSDKIKNAVFGNAGTLTFFRVGTDDAPYAFKALEEKFEEKDFLKLKMGNAYIKLLIEGAPSSPFSLFIDRKLMIDPFKEDAEVSQRIQKISRDTYGKDASEIEQMITERYSNVKQASQPSGQEPLEPQLKFDDDFFADL
jgi:hypothetical protein